MLTEEVAPAISKKRILSPDLPNGAMMPADPTRTKITATDLK